MHNVAILTGIERYNRLNQLPGTKHDVESMQSALVSRCSCAPDDVHVFTNSEEETNNYTVGNLFPQIERVIMPLKHAKADILFFYFSGHGYIEDEQPHLFFEDSSFLPDGPVNTLPVTRLERFLLDQNVANHVVIFIDACQSDLQEKGDGLAVKGAVRVPREGAIVFYSCSPHQASYAEDDGSVYTKQLAEILSDPDNFFTVEEISLELKRRVEEFAKSKNRKVDFQVPRTDVFDVNMGKMEIKERIQLTPDVPKPLVSNSQTVLGAPQPWIHHKSRIYKVYFSDVIHSSSNTHSLMCNVVLQEGDLPIMYGGTRRNSRTLIGQIDDSDIVVLLLDKTISATKLVKWSEWSSVIGNSRFSNSDTVPAFMAEYCYAIQRKKQIMLLYCPDEVEQLDDGAIKQMALSVINECSYDVHSDVSMVDVVDIPADSSSTVTVFQSRYSIFRSQLIEKTKGYVLADQNRLLSLLNMSVQREAYRQTVGTYVVSSGEMERTVPGDELHILTNDLINYDFTPISSLTIAMNTQKGVHYYYYGTKALKQSVLQLKEKIIQYYRKSFKARQLVVQWIRKQKSCEYDYRGFLTLIFSKPVQKNISDMLTTINQLGSLNEIYNECLTHDSECSDKNYFSKINIEKLLKWIQGESFSNETDIYKAIDKLNTLRIPFMNRFEEWEKYVEVRDFCNNIERLVNMSLLTQWQARADSGVPKNGELTISRDAITELVRYFMYTGDTISLTNRVISDKIEEWLMPKDNQIQCGEEHIDQSEINEYLSRIHFCQVDNEKPFILTYSFVLFICGVGPEAAWYTTYANTSSGTKNSVVVDNELMMIDLDDPVIRAELEAVFASIIMNNQSTLDELKSSESKVLENLGLTL